MTYCIDCNKPKKSNKSKRCHSCARIKQHESGVFNNKKLENHRLTELMLVGK